MRARVLLIPAVAVAATVWILIYPQDRPDPTPGADLSREVQQTSSTDPAVAPPEEIRAAISSLLIVRVTLDGAPVAADVEIRSASRDDRPSAPTSIATVRAEPGGPLEMALPPDTYLLVATTEEGRWGWTRKDVPLAGLRSDVEIRIRPGDCVLRGRARLKNGRPFAGHVVVWPRTHDLSGTDGRFSFSGLEPGEVHLAALVPGRFDVKGPAITLPREEEVEFVVDEGLSTFSGRVVALPDRTPIAGARLKTSQYARGTYHHAYAETDADGRFALDVHDVEISLQMEADGFQPVSRAVPAGTRNMELRLVRGAVLTGGVVRDEDGKPVPGTEVALSYGAWPHNGLKDSATTDERGRFAFAGAPCGTVVVSIGDDDWVGALRATGRSAGFAKLTLAPGESREVMLRARRAARIAGRVTDPRGVGIAGALVLARQGEASREAATNDSGRFLVPGLLPGVVAIVSAKAPGWARTTATHLVPLAVDSPPLEIRFPEPRWLPVTVLDAATGAPVAGAVAAAVGERPDGTWGGRWGGTAGTTDAEGRARVGPLPAGPIGVRIHHDDYVSVTDPVTAAPPDARGSLPPLTVRLERGTMISGRVLRPDGSLVHEGHVSSAYRPNELRCEIENGSFVLRGVGPDERVTLRAWCYVDGRGLSGRARATAGDEDVTIALEDEPSVDDPGPICLRLLDPSGKPVLWAEARSPEWDDWGVSYWPPGEVRVDEGHFRDRMRSSRIRLVVFGARTIDGTPLGCAHRGPIARDEIPVEVRLPPERAILGRVRTSDGRPTSDVRLTARKWASVVVSEAHTDGDGRFRLGGLGPGEYRIDVLQGPGVRPPDSTYASAGATDVEVVLPPSAAADVTVLDDRGRPVPGAEVESGSSEAITDARGLASLSGLDPEGDLDLRVKPPASRPDLGEAKREDWSPESVVVRLERRYTIAGIVRDEEGHPVAGATVYASRMEPRIRESASTRRDGAFRIRDLPEGSYDLSVGIPYSRPRPGPTGVEAGAEDVKVTIRRPLELMVRVEGWPADTRQLVALTRHGEDRSDHETVRRDGTARFEDVEPEGLYAILTGPVNGLRGYLREVRGDAGEVTLVLMPAASIRGRIVLPEGCDVSPGDVLVCVVAPGFDRAWRVGADGAYEVPDLPPGEWEVRAAGPGIRGAIRAAAGTTVDIAMKRE